MSHALPSLKPIPDDIDEHIQRLLRNPGTPELEPWLVELIKNSGHMSTGDDMRWRLLCTVWLAAEFDVDTAWPYLMWLNMNEPTMSTHLSQILIEAIDDLNAHVQVANWIAEADDERLVTFFHDFYPIPPRRKLPPLMTALFAEPTHPKIGVWLDAFCRGTAQDSSDGMRPWRLLAASWYAAGFDADKGVTYLRALMDGSSTLPAADNQLLTEAAEQTNGLIPLVQLVATCPDERVKTILKDFGHPDLPALVVSLFDNPPDYAYLVDAVKNVQDEVDAFQRHLICLEQMAVTPGSAEILDLACGPLATQTVLLNSAGYKTVGVDLDIPPGYLPLQNPLQWFKRNKLKKAWQQATNAYFQALAEKAGLNLKWSNVEIELADLTRLEMKDNRFDVVVCHNHLQHEPNMSGLLSEAARVLKPGGLFLADIRPFAGLRGALQQNTQMPWGHLRGEGIPLDSGQPLNKWREVQYRAALEKQFTIEQWAAELDEEARSLLTPEIQADLPGYQAEELVQKQIIVVAKKS